MKTFQPTDPRPSLDPRQLFVRLSVLVLCLLAAVSALAQSAPSAVWANSYTATSNQISWNPVPGATGYALYAGSASNTISSTPVVKTTASTATHSGLIAGNLYYYKVAAFYGTSRSPLSAMATCRTSAARQPGPIAYAVAGAGSVTLRYSGVQDATFYRIFRSTNGSNWVQVGATTGPVWVDNTVTDGVQYRYVVRGASADTDHLNSSEVWSIPGDVALPAPAATFAEAKTSSVNVSWESVNGAVGYVVFRGTDPTNEGYSPYATTNGTSFSDAGLTPGATYYYKVAAYDYSSTSAKGPGTSAKVGSTRLAAPVLAAFAGPAKVTLNWTAIAGATQYALFRKDPSGSWEFYVQTPNRSYTDLAVNPGTSYAYCAYAINVNGVGFVSNTVTAKPGTLIPKAPLGVYAIAANGYASIYWEPVVGATSYNLYRGTVAGKEKLFKTGVSSGTSDSGLTNGTTVYYRVRAVSKGTEGYPSATVSATPGIPRLAGTQLAAYPVAGKIELYWNLVAGATSYNVFRTDSSGTRMIKTKLVSPAGAAYGAVSDAALTPGVPYTYIVNAVSLDGMGSNSNSVVATAGNPPLAAPYATYAIAYSNQVSVYCTPVQGAVNYNVYRSLDPQNFGPMPYKVGASSSFADTGIVAGTTYFYRIAAVDEDGQSAFSAVCAATPGSASLPAPIVTGNTTGTSVALYWSPSQGATSYNIFRSVGGGTYAHYRQNVTDLFFVDQNVMPGTKYSYQIYPVSNSGMGSRSNTVHGRPGSTMLTAPNGLYGYSNSSSSNYLVWEPVVGATSYNIYRSTTPDGQGFVPIAVNLGTAYGDANLTGTVAYYYRVTAVNGNGQSLKSNEISVVAGSTRLAKVTLNIPTATAGRLTVTWSKNWNASGYALFRQMTGGDWKMVATGISAEGYADTDVIPGVEYSYQVVPYNVNGFGVFSNITKKVAQ